MLGFGKSKPVAEHEADGEIEQVYHEIRQVLRISGVSLNFRTWAGFGNFLPTLWDAVRENAGTRAFESAADRLRDEAVHAAQHLPRIQALRHCGLGESQTYQVRAALALYCAMNPKLLLLTCAARLALDGERVGGEPGDAARLPRGVPPHMYPMEMVDEKPDDARLSELFEDIRQTMALPSVNSVFRTLALWPNYLAKAWEQLQPGVQIGGHIHIATRLREQAGDLARRLPYPVALTREQLKGLGADENDIMDSVRRFEALLPRLIVDVSRLALDAELER